MMKLKIIIICLMLSGLTSYSQSERSYLLFVGPELDYKEAIGKTDTQGNKVGIWKYFRDDRSLVSVVPFENGKVNGNRRDFWETGNLYQSCDYVNNLKNGEQKIYFKNGLLYQNFYFKNDFKNGENKEFDINGDVYLIENYKNDELHGPYKSFYEGNLEEAGKYLEGKKEGTWTSYEEANVVQEVEYLNGLEDGLWKIRFYYKSSFSGKVKYEFNMIKGKLINPIKIYSYNDAFSENTSDDPDPNEAIYEIRKYCWTGSIVLSSFDSEYPSSFYKVGLWEMKDESGVLWSIMEYNKKGEVLSDTEFDKKGNITQYNKY